MLVSGRIALPGRLMRRLPRVSIGSVEAMLETNLGSGHASTRLMRAVRDFVVDPAPQNYFAIDRAFIDVMPTAGERAFTRALQQSEAGQAMLRDRYLAPKYTLDDLARCAPGTLGQAYRDHMIRWGLALDFFPPETLLNDFRFYRARTFQAHDIVHVVVGFGADTVGEMGVIAFMMGQAQRHLGVGVSTMTFLYGGLMGALYSINAAATNRDALGDYGKAVSEGWRIGELAAPFPNIHWEEKFDEPLDALRRQYNVAPRL